MTLTSGVDAGHNQCFRLPIRIGSEIFEDAPHVEGSGEVIRGRVSRMTDGCLRIKVQIYTVSR
jgi:hypothetical protein